jgi:hypothetical protein
VARKLPFVALPNCSFKEERGTQDFVSFFKKYAKKGQRIPRFDVFVGHDSNGGIITDLHQLLVYGVRPKEKLQRTLQQTESDLIARASEVLPELDRAPNFYKVVKHVVTGVEVRGRERFAAWWC